MKDWIKEKMESRDKKPKKGKKLNIPKLRAAARKEFKIGKGKKVDIEKIKKSRKKK